MESFNYSEKLINLKLKKQGRLNTKQELIQKINKTTNLIQMIQKI